MSASRVEVISALYEAFARRDLPKILELVHPEITVTQTPELPWGGDYVGVPGLQAFFGKLLEHIASQVTPEEYVEAGERVVMLGRTRGAVRANGSSFDFRAVHLWEVRDGRATRFEAYIDTPQMLAALDRAHVG